MDCNEFIASISDFVDGSLPSSEHGALEAHSAGCGSCRRYRNVVEHGTSLVRSLPEPELREDFEPRLMHKLYHVDDTKVISAQSGAVPMTVLGMALLLTAIAWAPTINTGPDDVVLEPIVIDEEPLPPLPVLLPDNAVMPASVVPVRADELPAGLFDETLLYDYSNVRQRYQQQPTLRRTSNPGR